MSDLAAKPEKPKVKKEKKPRSWKRIAIGIVVVVLALAGGGYWFMGRAAAAPKSAEEIEAAGERSLIVLEPFVVNLADDGGTHFLRANIQLIIDASEKDALALQEKKVEIMPLRSAVLELLSQQHSAMLVTPEGKDALKAAIKKRAGEVFHKFKVKDVLFSEFVVQF
jgi:flagellar FliL protein